MILDPNGMPILQPAIDNAETATFNDAIAAVGNAVVAVENVRQIQTYKWADNAARTAQTGMGAGDEGYQTDTDTNYRYDGAGWIVVGGDTGWIAAILNSGWTNNSGGDPIKYRRYRGVVYLRGRGDTTGTTVTAFTLPVGFRPAFTGYWLAESLGASFRMRVWDSGGVDQVSAQSTTHLSFFSCPPFIAEQ